MVRTKNTVNQGGTQWSVVARRGLILQSKPTAVPFYTQDVGGSSPSPPTMRPWLQLKPKQTLPGSIIRRAQHDLPTDHRGPWVKSRQ